ncbi:MAG: type III pantothenate kinase [Saprospiraceae bacterium]|nr:type III pantothenate kinase [Saprospiraceae bacterium]
MFRDLLVDVGNTNAKVAWMEGGAIGPVTRFASALLVENVLPMVMDDSVRYAIFSSTRHLSSEAMRSINEHVEVYTVSATLQLPFTVNYKTPHTVGPDRLCAVAAAQQIFPNESSLVIDAGTCITYDLIRKGQFYDGGNISPGIHMRLKAMNTFTDALPMVEADREIKFHGDSTKTALQVGAIWGAALEMRGFIQEYRERHGELNIVLTGGDAPYFVNRLKTEIFVSPKLVLQGLGTILQHHVGNAV